ncbi:hypothetical protein [Kineosporia sp. NBRC 101731]|uniref:hypothetical protein n=1 Tax=Kineosporia sp. NBRC 101731 TaxID=3032199 RepID=UPI0024A4A8B5|nr:hypothetical protein [Kineosporia sp. NBRC 101731]GLY32936.1 hypothetical protein Kisp02_63010 [Kineosporia sp. NBRC 101731]
MNLVAAERVPRILDPWPGAGPAAGAVEWVGRFRIDLVNGRGWPAPPAEIEVRRESVHLKHELVEVAAMSRRSFAGWLGASGAVPLKADHVVWSVHLGALVLAIGNTCYRLTDESWRQIVLLV